MITLSPISRIEGDLEVRVEIKDGRVVDAYASGVIFRGFEKLLRGRDPMDALVFTCRICGICSISQSTASSNALRDAFEAEMPPNAFLARNIVLAAETVMSHFTHFYILFMADLANEKYSAHPAHKELKRRFSPFVGTAYTKALRLRKKIMEIVGLLAGKWPNTLALQPTGTTRPVNAGEIIRARGILAEFQNSVEETLLGCSIDRWLKNKSLRDLNQWLNEADHEQSDLGLFIRCAQELRLNELGRGPGRFLSCGGYDLPDGSTWLKSGYFDGEFKSFDQTRITEYIKYSWFEGYEEGKHPFEGMTEPNVGKPQAYSWAKAPRYGGKTVEVGPLARMVIDRDPLALNLLKQMGPNVFTRCLMRVHEGIRLLKQIGVWLNQIDPDQPFYIKPQKPREAQGVGLTEAARGTLGHWILIEDGRIKNYQIITPSAWNLSPRDSEDNPGPVEEALIGTPVENEKNPVEVAHVIRSFDPCLFCTVHMARVDTRRSKFQS